MAESLNRKIARRYSKAVSNENFRSDGTLLATATVYDSTSSLPTSGIARGSQAYVSSNQRLYIRGTGGWYNIATINNTPSINSVQTAGGDSSPFTLATDGSTTTVITINATDSEGFPITFSVTTDVGFDSIATVSNDSSVFTITPFSEDSAGSATSGTLTFKASDGVNIASEVATFTLTFRVEQSNFTSALIKASGNNGTNITLNDASPSNRTITVGGDISAQAFTPFHPGGYSAYFDGSGDRLEIASIGDLSSTNYTIEGWYYFNTDPNSATHLLWSLNDEGTTGYAQLQTVSGTTTLRLQQRGGSHLSNGTFDFLTNTWYHIATVWDGSNMKVYVNGAEALSSTTNVIQNAGNGLTLNGDGGGSLQFQGYIRDFRIVTSAVYTSAGFTPPTAPLTAISNTELLVCHLPYLADGSSNDHTVTFSGNVALERFSPYNYLAYDPATHGASIYNDNTGDYMSVAADTTDLTMSGDFTIDFWIYPRAAKTNGLVYGKWANNSDGWAVFISPNYSSGNFGYLTFYYGNYGVNESATNLRSSVVTINQWHYIRITRSSGTMYMSVNGKVGTRTNYSSGITFTDNRTFNADAEIGICGNSIGYTVGDAFVSDLRVINGTALTTGNFTPPTSPATAVTNTKLLTCNDAPNVFNAAGTSNALALVGDAKSSTAQKKNASASMLFDGSGDYINLLANDNLAFGTGDFTIECWVYFTSISDSTLQILFHTGGTTSSLFFHADGNQLSTGTSNVFKVNESTTFTTNTWYHVAATRSNGISYVFRNGVLLGTGTADTTNYTSTGTARIGANGSGVQLMNGYIEDLRITKGLSRYPFIPAKETLTAISGTDLLVAHAATLVDGSSSGRTLTAGGNAAVSSFAPASGMYSIAFDGTNDNISVPTTSLGGTGDFTLEYWIYATSYSGTIGVIGDINTNGAGGWQAWWNPTAGEWRLGNNSTYGTGLNNYTGWSFTNTANKWYHHAWVRNSGSVDLFINGSKITSTTTVGTIGTQNLVDQTSKIGTFNDNSADLNGYISNLRIIEGTARYTNSFTPPAAELQG